MRHRPDSHCVEGEVVSDTDRCGYCESPLVVRAEGVVYTFKGHTDEFCRESARELLSLTRRMVKDLAFDKRFLENEISRFRGRAEVRASALEEVLAMLDEEISGAERLNASGYLNQRVTAMEDFADRIRAMLEEKP